MRVDPIGFDGGTNIYEYVSSNPINLVDYFGLAPTANGCGPDDWRNKLVPNRPYLVIDFTTACNNHDKCFGTCGALKTKCDKDFYDDMVFLCYQKYNWNSVTPAPPIYENLLNVCKSLANAYFQAVSNFGNEPYNNAQKCCP